MGVERDRFGSSGNLKVNEYIISNCWGGGFKKANNM